MTNWTFYPKQHILSQCLLVYPCQCLLKGFNQTYSQVVFQAFLFTVLCIISFKVISQKRWGWHSFPFLLVRVLWNLFSWQGLKAMVYFIPSLIPNQLLSSHSWVFWIDLVYVLITTVAELLENSMSWKTPDKRMKSIVSFHTACYSDALSNLFYNWMTVYILLFDS